VWEAGLLARRVAAAPLAPGFLLLLPRPEGPAEANVDRLAAAGIAALVSLLPVAEARSLGLDIGTLGRVCTGLGIRFEHAPLPDFAVPDAAFERDWRGLAEGRGVAFHCRAGLGRSGTMAARLLIELGLRPEEAIARIRAARPGAIETAEQERHLLTFARPAL
jgi:hypothetical protein